jgi:hypothetical protein
MARQEHLEHLKTQEEGAKARLDDQRRAWQAAQARRKAAERQLALEQHRAIGQMAAEAGLTTLDLTTLRGAFAHLAGLAQDPATVAGWRQARPGDNGAVSVPIAPQDGADREQQSSLPSFPVGKP